METKILILSQEQQYSKKSCKKILKLQSSCSSDLGDPLSFGSPKSYAAAAAECSLSLQMHLSKHASFLPLQAPKLKFHCSFVLKTKVNQKAAWSKTIWKRLALNQTSGAFLCSQTMWSVWIQAPDYWVV